MITEFGHGLLPDLEKGKKRTNWTLIYIVVQDPSIMNYGVEFNFDFIVVAPTQANPDSEQADQDSVKQVQSDTLQILQDFIAEVKNGSSYFYKDGSPIFEFADNSAIRALPFLEEHTSWVTGFNAQIRLQTADPLDQCKIPYGGEFDPPDETCPAIIISNSDGSYSEELSVSTVLPDNVITYKNNDTSVETVQNGELELSDVPYSLPAAVPSFGVPGNARINLFNTTLVNNIWVQLQMQRAADITLHIQPQDIALVDSALASLGVSIAVKPNSILPLLIPTPPSTEITYEVFHEDGIIPDVLVQDQDLNDLYDGSLAGLYDGGSNKFIIPVTATGMATSNADPYELWLDIGQSNMAGNPISIPIDSDGLDSPHPQIFELSRGGDTSTYFGAPAGEYQILRMPTQANNVLNDSINSSLEFAKERLKKNPHIKKILIVNRSVSGTSFSNNSWNVGDAVYEAAKDDVILALMNYPEFRFKGIRNQLGEGDAGAGMLEATYATAITDLIADLRANIPTAGSQVVYIQGTMLQDFLDGNGGATIAQAAEINNAQIGIADANSDYVDLSDITVTGGDGTHFDDIAQREIGRRYAAKAQTLVDAVDKYQYWSHRIRITDEGQRDIFEGGATVLGALPTLDADRGFVFNLNIEGSALDCTFNPDAYTKMCLIKLNAVPAGVEAGHVLSGSLTGVAADTHYFAYTGSGSTLRTGLKLEGHLDLDVWVAVALTYDGADYYLYVNGVEEVTVAVVDTLTGPQIVELGRLQGDDSERLDCEVDDIAILPYALSAAAVARHQTEFVIAGGNPAFYGWDFFTGGYRIAVWTTTSNASLFGIASDRLRLEISHGGAYVWNNLDAALKTDYNVSSGVMTMQMTVEYPNTIRDSGIGAFGILQNGSESAVNPLIGARIAPNNTQAAEDNLYVSDAGGFTYNFATGIICTTPQTFRIDYDFAATTIKFYHLTAPDTWVQIGTTQTKNIHGASNLDYHIAINDSLAATEHDEVWMDDFYGHNAAYATSTPNP
jgi:hypothetical protein